jgi:hypothetical protein
MNIPIAYMISKWDRLCNHEFEVRFQVDDRTSLQAITTGLPTDHCAYHYHIDFLADDDGKHRKRLNFPDGGAQTAPVSIRKLQVCKPLYWNTGLGSLKVTLSEEVPIPDLTLNNKVVKVVRIKLTLRYQIENWNLDISLVRELKNWTLPIIKTMRQGLLAPVKHIGDFQNRLRDFDRVEYEVEYTGQDLQEFDATRWYKLLYPNLDLDYQIELGNIASIIGNPFVKMFAQFDRRYDFTRLLPKAKEVPLEDWIEQFYPVLDGMIVRDKINGERCLLSIAGGEMVVLQNNKRTVYDGAQSPSYVFDCEYHGGTYWILHPLVLDSKMVIGVHDSERMQALEKQFGKIWNIADSYNVQLQLCSYRIIDTESDNLDEFYQEPKLYDTDGYIFATDQPYWEQRTMKWKKTSTIDFMLYRCPQELLGKRPYIKNTEGEIVWLLFHGISKADYKTYNKRRIDGYAKMFPDNTDYFPIQFSPHDNEYAHVWCFDPSTVDLTEKDMHGAIVELEYNTRLQQWTYVKIRNDRTSILHGGSYMGNSFRVVNDIWKRIHNPFSITYIGNPPLVDHVDIGGQYLQPYITEHPNADRVTAYNCSLDWDISKLLMVVEPDYRWLTTDDRITVVGSTDNAPTKFIGGTDLIAVAPGAKAARWQKWLAFGGTAYILTNGELPCDGANRIAQKSKYTVWQWKKCIAGAVPMTNEQVIVENPHLASCVVPQFRFKFTRFNNKEITAVDHIAAENTTSMHVDRQYGLRLCALEILSTLPSSTKVYYPGIAVQMRELFTTLVFLDPGMETAHNVDCLVLENNNDPWDMVEQLRPTWYAFATQYCELPKVIREHRINFIPYGDPANQLVWITGDGKRNTTVHVSQPVLKKEMEYYYGVYRPSCFKYTPILDNRDNCYDCRAESYVLSKYIRSVHAPRRSKSQMVRDMMMQVRKQLE